MKINGVKILKKGVRGTDGKYHPCFFSVGDRFEPGSGGQKIYRAAVIYARNYSALPKELNPVNNSDSMTDYFETDKVVYREGTPEFEIIAKVAK